MSTLSVVNALVFDGVSDELVDGPVHVVDGRIAAVGGPEQPADHILDARGGTVLPGLIDAHCHAYGIDLDMLALESRPLSYVALAAARRLGAALARGFTTVRDPSGGDAGLARAIAEGLIPAPRYLWTGPALSQTGGHGDVRAADSDVCGCSAHTVEVVDGVDPLRRAVRERFRRGAHAIKIMTSGGVVSLTDPIRIPQYSDDEIRAVTEEAARRGSYVAAHAYSSEAIRHAIDNGVRSIEHGNLLDADTAAAMAAAGAFLVPTLATYDAMERRGADVGMAAISRQKNREVLEAGREAVQLARTAGVRVGFGTDLMGALEDEQLNGLRLQVELDGVLTALRSATSVNAELIGRSDLGRIQEGAVADLLIVAGNPVENPAVLWSDRTKRIVLQGGVQI
ncbi:metal-dependent hydrolase family protein [Jatrophihabitans lederbergiae]|uniref:Amidohydrolase family protein n=1 Tax=Jatrophihabitans lederbergiae TaxID=3075547 RepID=A0ABU2JC56_9ACTN|nr:amidohydrolase family protein [Jatrophihabitans sp. DSM 44399]MDT0262054.1 amidohydrolase family protein [Jatrophihabitans sp. DSM 44399]